ncbi:MAG TPA: hypothetical protein VH092_20605 [Urbifossiella sp.]|nr:hypothetical protein [Urbifossiella sp.]
MLRTFPAAKGWMQRQGKKRGAKKAHAILEARIGRAVYHRWHSTPGSSWRRDGHRGVTVASGPEDQDPWRRKDLGG